MLIDATHAEETRVVVVDGNKVEEFDFESENKRQLAGNIYLAKVTRVEPSLQAAFVDYGGNRHGFLAFSEIHPDYYQIPVADREALMEEERAYAEAMRARDEEEDNKSSRPRRKSRGGKTRGAKAAAIETVASEAAAEVVTGTDAQPGVETADAGATAPAAGEISGMETIDLTDEASQDMAIAEVPESGETKGRGKRPSKDVAEDAPAEDAAAVEVAEAETVVETAAAPESADDVQTAAVTDYVEAVEVTDADAPVADAETAEPQATEGDDTPEGPSTIAAASDENDAVVSTEVPAEETPSEAPAAPDDAVAEEAAAPAEAETPASDTQAEDAAVDAPAQNDSAANDDDADEETPVKRSDATSKDDSIESVADEDDSEDIRPARKPRPRRYKIQEVIKVRQVLLVQVVKEERGNKGAALTTYLSLAGRYCVLMPNTARGGGISRKITNVADRKKLKEIATELDVPQGAGLIVRTAGAKRTKAEIKRDYEYLQRLWEQIRELTLKSIAPAKIYEEGDLIKRSIRDLYNREIDEVLVEGERGYRIAKDFMKMIMPSHAKNVKNYHDQMPLFARYQVESYLGGMFNPTVQLKSGGYIVIGVTEALVAIDVNSGRATKEGSIEDTATKTNLEAAEEVARQLRLRDLAGLIVIDFIDMDERKNNAAVEKRMKDKLKTDRARIQVGRISGFGLMEMSRQRLRPGMIEATTQPCHHCHGTGLIRSDDNMALAILRQIEEEGTRGKSREVLVRCPVSIANFLMNQKREHIAQIEARYGLSVRVEGDVHLVSPDFTIEKFKTASRNVTVIEAPVVSVDTSIMAEVDAEDADVIEGEAVDVTAAPEPDATEAEDETKPKRKRRRRRRRKSGGDEQSPAETQGGEANSESDVAADAAASDAPEGGADVDAEAAPKEEKKRRTRSRSRRRGKDNDQEKPAEVDAPVDAPVADAPAEADASAAAPEPAVEVAEAVSVETVAVVETPPAAAPVSEEPVQVEAPAEAVVEPAEVAAEPAPVAPVPEPEITQAVEVEADVAVAEKPAEPAKPKRRGWWSK